MDADLGKTSAAAGLGKAMEFTGPNAGSATTKFVDFGASIPELINLRSAPEAKATTVEYWIKTTQQGTTGNDTWTSPVVIGRESPADGDMYWGYINAAGNFNFSTSDIREVSATNVTDGKWHHIVMSKIWTLETSATTRFYIDGGKNAGGQSYETTTGPGASSQQDDDAAIQFLGFDPNGAGDNLQYVGQIDEVAIYNKAFNEALARIHFEASGLSNNQGGELKIESVSLSVAGEPSITWKSVSGTAYVVERADHLPAAGADWQSVGTVNATGATSSFTDTSRPAGANQLYYRLRRN